MRRIVGYDNCRPIWSDPEPSEPAEDALRLDALAGEFVRGEPGAVEKHRLIANAKRARDKADPERYERRRATWHGSKVRRGHAAA